LQHEGISGDGWRGFRADEMKKALRRHDTSVFEQTLVFGVARE
jgi:hypothetical protein